MRGLTRVDVACRSKACVAKTQAVFSLCWTGGNPYEYCRAGRGRHGEADGTGCGRVWDWRRGRGGSRLKAGRLENLGQKPHVVIDFSHPDNTDSLCGFCAERGVKAVIGCTGHSAEQKERIRKLAESCGVVMSANFSYGLNVLLSLAGQAAALLGDGFDTELCETHHRRKTGRAERHRARALGGFEGSRRKRGGFRQERTRTETGKRDRSERAARRPAFAADTRSCFWERPRR